MEKQTDTNKIWVSILWEHKDKAQAERVQRDMAATGLPPMLQRKLCDFVQAANWLCECGCPTTRRRVQVALCKIWGWVLPAERG